MILLYFVLWFTDSGTCMPDILSLYQVCCTCELVSICKYLIYYRSLAGKANCRVFNQQENVFN